MPAARAANRTASQTTRGVIGVGAPAVFRAREEIRLRVHPPVVLSEGGEESRTERHLAIDAPFAAFDAKHHARAVDVGDLQVTELAPAQARPVERQQHRAVKEISCVRDQTPHLLGTEDRGEPPVTFRGGQFLLQPAALQDAHIEEAERGDMEADGADGELALFEQGRLIPPEIAGAEPIEATAGMLAATGVESV